MFGLVDGMRDRFNPDHFAMVLKTGAVARSPYAWIGRPAEGVDRDPVGRCQTRFAGNFVVRARTNADDNGVDLKFGPVFQAGRHGTFRFLQT